MESREGTRDTTVRRRATAGMANNRRPATRRATGHLPAPGPQAVALALPNRLQRPRDESQMRLRRLRSLRRTARVRGCHSGLPPRRPPQQTESSRHRISRAHPFTSEQFHVLLNSLFKVLCNFPSRYLFAIGLTAVFSLRWSLPPDWGCTPKQPDSKEIAYGPDPAAMGLAPATDRPRSGGLAAGSGTDTLTPERHISRDRRPGIRRWALPFSLAVTKGIPVGFFSSAYLYA